MFGIREGIELVEKEYTKNKQYKGLSARTMVYLRTRKFLGIKEEDFKVGNKYGKNTTDYITVLMTTNGNMYTLDKFFRYGDEGIVNLEVFSEKVKWLLEEEGYKESDYMEYISKIIN